MSDEKCKCYYCNKTTNKDEAKVVQIREDGLIHYICPSCYDDIPMWHYEQM